MNEFERYLRLIRDEKRAKYLGRQDALRKRRNEEREQKVDPPNMVNVNRIREDPLDGRNPNGARTKQGKDPLSEYFT